MQTPTEQNQLKICVIEEHDVMREMIATTLHRFAPQAIVKMTGDHGDGLTMVTDGDFDVILINEGRPGASAFSGSKACFLIRELCPKSRIILMSGFKKEKDKPSVVDLFLEKPFTHEELMTAVLMT